MQRGFGYQNRRNAGFSPASLFTGGVQGAWYDPSDLTTLFQDSAGTTPVTAVEQPVGLMLDKSKGLVLGPELVTTYYSGGAYNNWSGMTLAGTTLTTVSAPTNGYTARFNVTAGQTYRVAIPATLVPSGGTWSIKVSWSANGTAYSGQIVSVPISTTWFVFVPPATAVSCEVTITRDVASSPGATDTIGPFTGFSVRLLSGNHAFQTTSASRPTLRARYNLLTRSEEFNDAAWIKANSTVTANAAVAPDGTTTADLLYPTTTGTNRGVYQSGPGTTAASVTSVYVKSSGKSWIWVVGAIGSASSGVYFNVSTGTKGFEYPGYTGTITAVGNGWYRLVVSNPSSAMNFGQITLVDADASNSITANGTDGVLIWGAQLVPTAVFPSNTYQRIGAATDYATGAAFPPYLAFDGVDDSMLTNSVDFSGTDKMLVVAGVTKNSDVATAILAELSATLSSNNGAFWLAAPVAGGSANYEFRSKGTTEASANYTNAAVAAPRTNVVSGIGDIGADTSLLRVNGAQVASNASDQGTGNFGNYPLYIGRRNNASLPFNGNLYSMIIAGQSYAAGQITSTEQWVAARTPLGSI